MPEVITGSHRDTLRTVVLSHSSCLAGEQRLLGPSINIQGVSPDLSGYITVYSVDEAPVAF